MLGCYRDRNDGPAGHAPDRNDASAGDARRSGWNVGGHDKRGAVRQRAKRGAQRCGAAAIAFALTRPGAANEFDVDRAQCFADQFGVAVPGNHRGDPDI